MILSVYTDGGSRGNPGISGFGVAIYNENKEVITKISKFLGVKTNNEAEYLGMIEALTWVCNHQSGISQVNFYSDSQLLVRQILGKYKVKAKNIKPLHQTIISLLSQITPPCHFHEVLRQSNQLADELANQAMDQKQ